MAILDNSPGFASPLYQPGQQFPPDRLSALVMAAQSLGIHPGNAAPVVPVQSQLPDGTMVPQPGQEGTTPVQSSALAQMAPQQTEQAQQVVTSPALASLPVEQKIEETGPNYWERYLALSQGGPQALQELYKGHEIKKLGKQMGGVFGQLLQSGASLPEAVAVANLMQKPEAQSGAGKIEADYLAGRIDKATRDGLIAKETGSTTAPFTDSGKLNADLQAGRITQAQYDAAIKSEGNKKFTEAQLNAAAFVNRMKEASTKINELEDKFGNSLINPVSEGLGTVVPDALGGQALANKALDPKQQEYKNAGRAWIRANLRKESGAAIGADEEANEFRTYFPQVGDSQEVIAQKRVLRNNTENSLVAQSNGAFDGISSGGKTLSGTGSAAPKAAAYTPDQQKRAAEILAQRRAGKQ